MDATETTIYHAIVIACVVIGTILLFFFILLIRQQHINMALRKKNLLNEMAILEKDRARIAADLHDELGPLLSLAKMRIRSLEFTDKENLMALSKINSHIDNAIKRIREISFNLTPDTLLKEGLVKAMREYIDFLNQENHIDFTFPPENNLMINVNKSLNVYRIVQELLHNAIKHSKATEISVELRNKKHMLLLRVSDNGIGFDYKKKLTERAGIGLGSINNRTKIAEGKMFMESSPENGTMCILEIPL